MLPGRCWRLAVEDDGTSVLRGSGIFIGCLRSMNRQFEIADFCWSSADRLKVAINA